MEILPFYKKSFFASPDIEKGLNLTILYDEGIVFCDLMLDKRFAAGDGYVYGGLLFGVMDSLMWYAILMEKKKIAMTRKIDVDFFVPVECDKLYRVKGRVDAVEEKDIGATGWIEDASGTVCTQVKAVFRESKAISPEGMISKLDFKSTSPKIRKFFHSLGKSNY